MDDDDFDEKPTPEPGKRRAPLTLSDSARAKHLKSWVRGVPVVMPPPMDESTAPLELLLNGSLTPEDYAQIETLKRASYDEYTMLLNLAKAMSGKIKSDQSGSKELADQVAKAVKDQSDRLVAVEKDNAAIKGKLTWAQGIAGGAIALALASAGGLVSKIWDRAGDEREAKVERRYMQQDIDWLKQRAREPRKDTP